MFRRSCSAVAQWLGYPKGFRNPESWSLNLDRFCKRLNLSSRKRAFLFFLKRMFLWEFPSGAPVWGVYGMKTPIWDPSGDVSQDGFLSHNRPFKQEPPFSSVGPQLAWCLSQSIKRGLQAWLSSVFRMMLRDIQVAWKYTRYLFHKKPLFRCLLCIQNDLDRFM